MSEPEKKVQSEEEVRPEDRPYLLILDLTMYPTEDQYPKKDPTEIGISFPMCVSPEVLQEDETSRTTLLRMIFDHFLVDLDPELAGDEDKIKDLWAHAVRSVKNRRAVLDEPPVEKVRDPEGDHSTFEYDESSEKKVDQRDPSVVSRVESITDYTFQEWVDLVRRGQSALADAEGLVRVCYPISENVVVVFDPQGVEKDKFSQRYHSSEIDLGTKVVNGDGVEVRATDLSVPELAMIAAVRKMIEDWQVGRGPLAPAEPLSYHVKTDSQG